MKKKKLQVNNGITVCDSIVMSIKQKRLNTRQIEAVFIAIVGYVSSIMAFVKMFDFKYNHEPVIFAAVVFSAVYAVLSLAGKKVMWIVITSAVGGCVIAYRSINKLVLGYKYVFNVIYSKSMHREIDYYKFLKPENEREYVTALFIFGTWLLAIVIYTFTVYHPNSLPPLLVTFPLIEIGLYNGIEISIFWGMLTIAYWLAVFAMTATDMGEYSGGNGGFVRKDNTFFPKRQMKLKVTEKCGIYIIISVMAVAGISSAVLDFTDYKRSDEINKKRIEIRDAVNSFSADDLAGSVSQLTSAFGFTFKVRAHRLGNIDRMRYKNTTDMIVTLDHEYNGALYLKEYTGSVYNNNEWLPLDDSAYNEKIFSDFSNYGIYPQDFPYIFNRGVNALSSEFMAEYNINIDSKLKRNRSFAPYGTDSIGIIDYEYDSNVTSKSGNEYSYNFTKVDSDTVMYMDAPFVYNFNINDMTDDNMYDMLDEYCSDKNIIDGGGNISVSSEFLIYDSADVILAKLIQSDYQDFVHRHYLQVPNTSEMADIRNAFSDVLVTGSDAASKIQTLKAIRDKISSMTEYSLNPGRTPNTRDFVNYFLLENHKGYCTHYATAGVMLARMAGIPARYAAGYVIVGDDFNEANKNPDYSYTLELKDNRSHAWIEVYIDGYGWIPFEMTAGYSEQTIDTTPTTTTTTVSTSTETTAVEEQESETTTQDVVTPTTTQQNTTEAGTSFTVTTFVTSLVSGIPEAKPAEIPKAVIYTVYTLLAMVALAVLVYIRRYIVLYIRNRRFSEGSRKSRMGHIYAYAEKLLKYLDTEQKEMSYKEFAEAVEKSFGGKYFSNDSFSEFMNIALKSAFSESAPEKSEIDKCRKFTKKFAENIYNDSDTLHRFCLKFVIVLI